LGCGIRSTPRPTVSAVVRATNGRIAIYVEEAAPIYIHGNFSTDRPGLVCSKSPLQHTDRRSIAEPGGCRARSSVKYLQNFAQSTFLEPWCDGSFWKSRVKPSSDMGRAS
jgi:hypothetical protein